MNNRARQNYFKPSSLQDNQQDNQIANDFTYERAEPSYQDQTQGFIHFRNMMRAEKRQSFWSGVALTTGVVIALTLFFVAMSSSGMSFMTCNEFGETFTCRFGGL